MGLSFLVVILDFLAHAEEVLESSNGEATALFRYTLLRLPEIMSDMIPFSVLLAVLMTLSGLVRMQELVALRSAGVSQFRLILALLPAAILVAGSQFLLNDNLVPGSVRGLRAWGIGDYKELVNNGTQTWLRDGDMIISVRAVDDDNNAMHGVTIYLRDADGVLTERIFAAEARRETGGWVLNEVTRIRMSDQSTENFPSMPWNGEFRPALFSSFAVHPRELTFKEVRKFVGETAFGNRPKYFYLTWLHKKIAVPVASLLMLLLTVPLAQRFQREGGHAWMLTIGVAVGFIYFVVDGLTLTIGEAGLLPPVIAAWGPTLLFGLVGASIAFHHERH